MPLATDGVPARLLVDNPQGLAVELRGVHCPGASTLTLAVKPSRLVLTLVPAPPDAGRCDAELLVRDARGGATIGTVPVFGQIGRALATPWPDVAPVREQ